MVKIRLVTKRDFRMMKYYPDIGKALSDVTKGMIATEIILLYYLII